MDAFTLLSPLVGTALVAVVVLDVTLTVLHIDVSGRLGTWWQRSIWRVSVAVIRRRPRARYRVLAAAGPVMIVATYALWIALYVVGFALIYWPFLDRFRSADPIGTLGFFDALYFSGATGTVLGFGDITPLTPGLKVLSVIEAGVGFALLTGVITFLISLVAGVTQRNALATRLHDESDGTFDGVVLVLRSLSIEGVEALRDRLTSLASELRDLVETMHQFPVLDLYFRSADPAREVESLLRTATETALVARILAQDPALASLRLVAADLQTIVERRMSVMARQHMPSDVAARLRDPEPSDTDRAWVDAVHERLRDGTSLTCAFRSQAERDAVDALACRSARIMAELSRLTGWTDPRGERAPSAETAGRRSVN
jgi:hypothetical protein